MRAGYWKKQCFDDKRAMLSNANSGHCSLFECVEADITIADSVVNKLHILAQSYVHTIYLRSHRNTIRVVKMKLFLSLWILFNLIGCQSTPVALENSNMDNIPDAKTVAMKGRSVDYKNMVAISGFKDLIEVEQYGVYELLDSVGDIEFIRLRVKFTNLDDQSSRKLINERDLLNIFFHGVSTLVSTETGVETQKIELIAQAGGCQIHALAGHVKDVKCPKAPIKVTGSDNSFFIKTSIKQYADCLNSGANHAFCLSYAASSGNRSVASDASILTKEKLKQFCVNTLTKEFSDHDFESDCKIVHNKTERYFSIKDIHTKGYITDGYWEQFTIRLSYLYGKNAGQEFIGDLKMVNGKCVARIMFRGNRPEEYGDDLNQCGEKIYQEVLTAEDDFANWFNQYFAEEKEI
jgi:hypothetical protein